MRIKASSSLLSQERKTYIFESSERRTVNGRKLDGEYDQSKEKLHGATTKGWFQLMIFWFCFCENQIWFYDMMEILSCYVLRSQRFVEESYEIIQQLVWGIFVDCRVESSEKENRDGSEYERGVSDALGRSRVRQRSKRCHSREGSKAKISSWTMLLEWASMSFDTEPLSYSICICWRWRFGSK